MARPDNADYDPSAGEILNFSAYLFGIGMAASQTQMFADNMMLYGMEPITPGNGQVVRLLSWSPIRYYQQ